MLLVQPLTRGSNALYLKKHLRSLRVSGSSVVFLFLKLVKFDIRVPISWIFISVPFLCLFCVGLPGVLWVLPDSYIDVKNKDYGGS